MNEIDELVKRFRSTLTNRRTDRWCVRWRVGHNLGPDGGRPAESFQNGEWGIQGATLDREGLLPVDDTPISDQAREYNAGPRAGFERTGPTFYNPTAAWLDAIDPSPANLRHAIEAGPCIDGRTLSTTVYEDTIDRHPYRVVSVPGHPHDRRGDRYARLEFYIDPIARRFAGWPRCRPRPRPAFRSVRPGTRRSGQPHRAPTGAECDEAAPLREPDRFLVILVDQTLLTRRRVGRKTRLQYRPEE